MRVCSICVAVNGLSGRDLVKGGPKDLDDDEDFANHMENEHNMPVQRKGETKKQTMARFKREHPEAQDPKTCRCPEHQAERGDFALRKNVGGD